MSQEIPTHSIDCCIWAVLSSKCRSPLSRIICWKILERWYVVFNTTASSRTFSNVLLVYKCLALQRSAQLLFVVQRCIVRVANSSRLIAVLNILIVFRVFSVLYLQPLTPPPGFHFIDLSCRSEDPRYCTVSYSVLRHVIFTYLRFRNVCLFSTTATVNMDLGVVSAINICI